MIKRELRLTMIKPRTSLRRAVWFDLYRCSCGTEKEIARVDIKRGAVFSCGCLHKEITAEANRTHGKVSHPLYKVWSGMHDRCRNSKKWAYHRYGGRGIKVCERWNNFANFFADMGPRPSKNHSIDRIDNDGNYEPGNCRWATRAEQAANTSQSILITLHGETKTLTEWCRQFSISVSGATSRRHCGASWERVFSKPVGEWNNGRYGTKTHCRRGHPRTTKNTWFSSRGHGVCRLCANETQNARRRAVRKDQNAES